MKVIILAAGVGKRLYPLTKNVPKCLLKVGDRTLLDYVLSDLARLQAGEVLIVTGHGGDAVEQAARSFELSVNFIYNPDYASKDNIYSLWCAREELEAGCVIFNSDVICHPDILKRAFVFVEEARDFLVIDDWKPLDEEDMKVRLGSGKVEAISKDLAVSEAQGEYIGVAGFSPDGGKVLAATLDRIIEDKRFHEFYEAAFQEMAPHHEIEALSTERLPWMEIDDFDDLKQAEEMLLSQIGGSGLV